MFSDSDSNLITNVREIVAKMLFLFHQLWLMAFGIVLLAGHNWLLPPPPKKNQKQTNEDLWHFKRLWWWFWSVMSLELLPAVAMASFCLGVGPPCWKRDSLQSEAGSHCLSQKKSQLFGLAQLQPPRHSILLNGGITMTPPVTSRAIRIPCLLIAPPAQCFLSFNKITWNTLY